MKTKKTKKVHLRGHGIDESEAVILVEPNVTSVTVPYFCQHGIAVAIFGPEVDGEGIEIWRLIKSDCPQHIGRGLRR